MLSNAPSNLRAVLPACCHVKPAQHRAGNTTGRAKGIKGMTTGMSSFQGSQAQDRGGGSQSNCQLTCAGL